MLSENFNMINGEFTWSCNVESYTLILNELITLGGFNPMTPVYQVYFSIIPIVIVTKVDLYNVTI